ncbi:MAG TPA: hypothetical protein DCP63_01010 [Bacteroidetes bacterium]|nr:hypothetical protein [Bacteroidota bacterium]
MSVNTPRAFTTLDARDTFCPLPVIRAQKAIQEIPVGRILEILATDDGSAGDIPAWAKNTGHEFLAHDEDEYGHRFLIRRGK